MNDKFKRISLIIICVLALTVFITTMHTVSSSASENSSSAQSIAMLDVDGKSVIDAVQILTEAGFINITLGDDNVDILSDNCTVSGQNFSFGDMISPDDKIVLDVEEKCSLRLKVNSAENLLFSTYDIDLYLDDDKVGTIENGKGIDSKIDTTSGEHIIKAVDVEDESISGTYKINVKSDMTFTSELDHDSASITFNNPTTFKGVSDSEHYMPNLKGKTVADAKKVLSDMGISDDNITCSPSVDDYLEDSYKVKSQSVKADTLIKKNQKITLKCYEIDEYESDGIKVSFSKTKAMRAAVVAFTNATAKDVKTNNKYDKSKFHSFDDDSDDLTDYYVIVKENGSWSVKNKNTWHVDGLTLQKYGYPDDDIEISWDVSYKDKKYHLSNFEYSSSENNVYKIKDGKAYDTVTKGLVEYGRDSEIENEDINTLSSDSGNDSDELDQALAMRIFEEYGNQIYDKFTCHWWTGTLYKEHMDDGGYFFKVKVTIKQSGIKYKGIAEGKVYEDGVIGFNVH